ncbi:hypothetical protein NFI96_031836 [Prochilodus magdalenae]|nr:hypothetical protein NFI96_031836 [Prochilodus magdalenae]
MKLLRCLYLCSLFCSVYSVLPKCLMCASHVGQCTLATLTECEPGLVCSALRFNILASGFGVNTTRVARICLEQNLCSLLSATRSGITYTANFGVVSILGFLSCCDTDLCNNIYIPEFNIKPNGLKCPSCSGPEDTVCDTPVSCVGNQDYCANGTIPDMQVFGSAVNIPVKGCASKTVCEAKNVGNFTCSFNRISNGSEALRMLDLRVLLMILTATILFQ